MAINDKETNQTRLILENLPSGQEFSATSSLLNKIFDLAAVSGIIPSDEQIQTRQEMLPQIDESQQEQTQEIALGKTLQAALSEYKAAVRSGESEGIFKKITNVYWLFAYMESNSLEPTETPSATVLATKEDQVLYSIAGCLSIFENSKEEILPLELTEPLEFFLEMHELIYRHPLLQGKIVSAELLRHIFERLTSQKTPKEISAETDKIFKEIEQQVINQPNEKFVFDDNGKLLVLLPPDTKINRELVFRSKATHLYLTAEICVRQGKLHAPEALFGQALYFALIAGDRQLEQLCRKWLFQLTGSTTY